MLSIYMKPTNWCTVDCEHCYLPEETRANRETMTDQTLIDTINLVKNMAKLERHEMVHFTWHGGEPLMLSPDWFYNAGDLLDKHLGPGYYTESIQTSLIPFKERWVQLIKDRYSSCIGTSVDFTQRKLRGTNDGYLELFMKKVDLAREHDLYVTPGMVPTKHEVGRGAEIVDWCVDKGFVELNIERYSKVGTMQSLDWPSNKQHAQFLIEVFDRVMERIENGQRSLAINTITSGLMGVILGMPGDRWGTNCQREFIVVEPNGNLNTCPDRAMHESPFSNTSQGAQAFKESSGRRNWIRIMDVTHKRDHCMVCEYKSWCRSGCPVTPNGPKDGQEECAGFKSYLTHIHNYFESSPERKEICMEYMKPLGEQIIQDKSLLEL